MKLKVRYSSENKPVETHTYNIGTNGLFIVDDNPKPQGSLFSVEVEIPDCSDILVFAVSVAWTGFASPKIKGMGVMFHSQGESQKKFDLFLARIGRSAPQSTTHGDAASLHLQEKAARWDI
jgi:Tfp pilus assembly protein PilZ